MNPCSVLLRAGCCLGALAAAVSASATNYTVSTLSDLQAKITAAAPGDTITVKNGTYTSTGQITVAAVGTADAPIVITAETIGAVEIKGTAGFTFAKPAAYVTVEGFKFTHTSGTISIPTGTSHVRFSRNIVECTGSGSYIRISGDDAEIDHNELRNKSTLGEMLDISGSGSQVARRLWVHHNYFHDFSSPGGNGAETIRWGLSGLSLSTGDGICEYNLFVNCVGENECISNKSSGNIYRYNTFLNQPGAELSQRHGNNCLIYGNYFRNTAGIRIYGDSHQIFSNYLEGNSNGINIGNGDGDVYAGDPLTSHDRPDNNVITFNTLINNSVQYQMNGRTGGLGSTNTTFANNIIVGGGKAASISTTAPYSGLWAGNIVWNVGSVGDIPAGTYDVVDPLLAPDTNGVYHLQAGSPAIDSSVGTYPFVTYDLDGQPRDSLPDRGADEFSSAPITAKILTPADVGTGSTATPPPPPTVTPLSFESENLSFTTTGATASVSNETTATGGLFASNFKYVNFGADGNPPPPNGEYIDFVLPGVPAGTYEFVMRWKSNTNRGTTQLYLDGAPLGAPLDQYAKAAFKETDFGVVRFPTDGDHVVRLAVVGKNSASSSFILTSDLFKLTPDKTPPVLTLPADIIVEATSPDGAVVNFTATATDDKDGPVPVTLTPPSGSVFPLGDTIVVASATDFAGNRTDDGFVVSVVDTTPPTINSLTPSLTSLWPANHKMVAVTIAADVSDIADPSPRAKIISVTSNEPVTGTGNGDIGPDWEITGDLTLNLRAERAGAGTGRVYTVTVECRDASDNATTSTVTVVVPKSQAK